MWSNVSNDKIVKSNNGFLTNYIRLSMNRTSKYFDKVEIIITKM